MAYALQEPRPGYGSFAAADPGITPPGSGSATNIPTPPYTLGQVVKAFDPTFGEGEFIFLKGVASTIVGSMVVWDGTTYATTLCATTANQGRPVAFAMSASIGSGTAIWGWYQIGGTAVAVKSAVAIAATTTLGVSSTGKVGASASGKQVLGARTANAATVASATTTINVVIDRPHLQGRVT